MDGPVHRECFREFELCKLVIELHLAIILKALRKLNEPKSNLTISYFFLKVYILSETALMKEVAKKVNSISSRRN